MKHLCSLIISLFVLFTTNLCLAFEIQAEKAILMDSDTSEIIYEKNSKERTPPSSMAKLMTSYVIFDMLKNNEIKLDDKVTVSTKAWKETGSRMFLKWGSGVSFDELLYGLVVVSGNDAAVALAEGAPQGYNYFINRMNETAKELGLKDSSFSNAVGWSEEGTYMTLEDIAILSQKTIQNFPQYYARYFPVKEYKYNKIKQPNRNLLLWEYDGVDGLKTGHTEEGGYGMAVSAVKNGRRLIAVVNGLSSERERAEEIRKLLRYGFDVCDRVELFTKGKEAGKAKVWMGKKSEINLIAQNNIFVTVEKRYLKDLSYEIEADKYIKAPIKKGDIIAKLVVKHSKDKTESFDLVAGESVKRLGFFGRIWFWVRYWVGKIV